MGRREQGADKDEFPSAEICCYPFAVVSCRFEGRKVKRGLALFLDWFFDK